MIKTMEELEGYLSEKWEEGEHSWVYMVFRTLNKTLPEHPCYVYSIRDVLVSKEDGKILVGWAAEPQYPIADHYVGDPGSWKKQMKNDLKSMMKALDYELVDEDSVLESEIKK